MKILLYSMVLFLLPFTLNAQHKITSNAGGIISGIQTLDSITATNIVVFSNDKCGRCHTLMQMLDEKELKYLEYDLGIEENRKVMYELATRAAGATNISVAYPVVAFRDMVLYGQEGMAEFVVKLLEAHQP